MKTLISVKKLALGLALGGLFAWQAGATVAYTTPPGLPGTQQDGPYTLADVFTPSSSIVVDALGAFTANGNFSGTVDVAIYAVTSLGGSVSGSLISPVAAFNGSYTPGTVFQSIAPVTLAANSTYMVVANNYGGVNGAAENYNPAWDPANGGIYPSNPVHTGSNPLITANGLTFSQIGYYSGSGALGSTLNLNGDTFWTAGGPHYGAGNFDFTPVPEAAGFALAGVALLGLVYAGRVYSQKLKLA
jgi:hypothetical protein